jgi:hypothetical protein
VRGWSCPSLSRLTDSVLIKVSLRHRLPRLRFAAGPASAAPVTKGTVVSVHPATECGLDSAIVVGASREGPE